MINSGTDERGVGDDAGAVPPCRRTGHRRACRWREFRDLGSERPRAPRSFAQPARSGGWFRPWRDRATAGGVLRDVSSRPTCVSGCPNAHLSCVAHARVDQAMTAASTDAVAPASRTTSSTDDDRACDQQRRHDAAGARTDGAGEEWVRKQLAKAPPLSEDRWRRIAGIIATPARRDQDRTGFRASSPVESGRPEARPQSRGAAAPRQDQAKPRRRSSVGVSQPPAA